MIVSDGIETTSRITDFDHVVQHVLADDCQIYVVQTGLYEGANLRALAAERRMEQLSAQTGGAVYLPKTTAQLDLAFDQIAADLAQQYVLSYYPSAEQRDGRLHRLELRVKSRNDVRVRSRKGYYAPKPAGFSRLVSRAFEMEKLIEQFLEHLRYERNVSAHTLRNYSSDLEQFFIFLTSRMERETRLRFLRSII